MRLEAQPHPVACAPSSGNTEVLYHFKVADDHALAELTRRKCETSPTLAGEPVG